VLCKHDPDPEFPPRLRHDSRHEAVIDVSKLPLDLPCPDVALRLRCSACGSKRIRVRLNMVEYYEVPRRKTGWQAPA
jgi:hypothetical protein